MANTVRVSIVQFREPRGPREEVLFSVTFSTLATDRGIVQMIPADVLRQIDPDRQPVVQIETY